MINSQKIPLAALSLLILLLASCTPESTLTPTPTQVDLAAEEEAVYAALFEGMYGEPRMLVLMFETSAGMGGIEGWEAPPALSALDPETVDDFRLRNDAAYPLPLKMELGLPYVLLTPEEMNQIFDVNTSGWDVFYTRYPNSPGISTVSRVGFNTQFTQALVYIGTMSHWLAGAGYYVLLEKSSGTWEILQQSMAWIS